MVLIGNTKYNILFMAVSTVPFYFVNLETFYIDEMYFPPYNGPDEGSIILTMIWLVTGLIGTSNLWNFKIILFGYKIYF
jgi:hypothetical protein